MTDVESRTKSQTSFTPSFLASLPILFLVRSKLFLCICQSYSNFDCIHFLLDICHLQTCAEREKTWHERVTRCLTRRSGTGGRAPHPSFPSAALSSPIPRSCPCSSSPSRILNSSPSPATFFFHLHLYQIFSRNWNRGLTRVSSRNIWRRCSHRGRCGRPTSTASSPWSGGPLLPRKPYVFLRELEKCLQIFQEIFFFFVLNV